MKAILTICILSILGLGNQVSAQNFWKTSRTSIQPKSNQRIYANPTKSTTYDLEFENLRRYLTKAPNEVFNGKQKGIQLDIPQPDGQVKSYTIFESPSMQAGLQAKYPDIKSYKGYSLDNKENLRLTVSKEGFFGSIATPNGTIYLDPVVANQNTQYYSYYVRDNHNEVAPAQLACGHQLLGESESNLDNIDYDNLKVNNEPVDMRVYRFAVSTTAEWTARNGGTTESGLAAVVMTVDRLNLIYENEVAIRLLLVDNNDTVIYTDPATDPFAMPEEGFVMLGQNTSFLNNSIGAANYDFGHVYGLCTDTGGVASLQSVCTPETKGAGVSCFQTDLITVTVSVVAHEIGHQMGAQHTFNNCTADNMTLENESPGNAYEPGSGSTIMSYAGLCPLGNNVRGDNFDKYHVASLVQIKNYMFLGRGDGCAEKMSTTNVSPSIDLDYTNGFYIPMQTPFELSCEATDPNNDPITYSWEQFNIGTLSPLGTPLGSAPSFESLPPTENPARTFPSLRTIIFNRNTDTEVLPEGSRDFTFRVTARDNSTQGGGTCWEEVKFKSTDQAGPFEVTFPSRVENLTVGDELDVTWDVANTDQSLVNCQKVDIYLSSDGGFNFDKALALNTPNDGNEIVYVPNIVSEEVRIRVSAADNIFFDIGNLDSKIIEPSGPDFYVETELTPGLICLPTTLDIPISTAGFQGYNEQIQFTVADGLPAGATYTFEPEVVNPSESSMLRIDLSGVNESGEYAVNVRSTSGSITHDRAVNLVIVNNNFSDLAVVSPAANSSEIGVLPTFEWTASNSADTYRIEVATSPAFGETTIISEGGLTTNRFTPPATLSAGELYYWRITPSNRCSAGGPTSIQTFHTLALACGESVSSDTPLNISASGTRVIDAFVSLEGGTISDINVKQIAGTHERVSDLKFSIVSPAGTTVVLANRKCGNSSNFNVGFDDEAPSPLVCPISNGTSFQPEEALSAFIGEPADGLWNVKIEDLAPGSGGQVNDIVLETCGAVSVQNPFFVNNDTHNIPPGASARISSDILRVDDNNNTADELTFTIISLPAHGDIVLNEGAPAQIGATFTQRDINNGNLRYFHDGGNSTTDSFQFVVEDGEGGFIGVTNFLIDIDASHTTNISELQQSLGINIYPNPVQDQLIITSEIKTTTQLKITLRDMQGRLISNLISTGQINEKINVKGIDAGIYFLSFEDSEHIYTEKIIVE